MAYTATATAAKPRRPITRTFSVYVKSLLTTKMPLNITEVGKNVAAKCLREEAAVVREDSRFDQKRAIKPRGD